jgi:hypothetical protein
MDKIPGYDRFTVAAMDNIAFQEVNEFLRFVVSSTWGAFITSRFLQDFQGYPQPLPLAQTHGNPWIYGNKSA